LTTPPHFELKEKELHVMGVTQVGTWFKFGGDY